MASPTSFGATPTPSSGLICPSALRCVEFSAAPGRCRCVDVELLRLGLITHRLDVSVVSDQYMSRRRGWLNSGRRSVGGVATRGTDHNDQQKSEDAPSRDEPPYRPANRSAVGDEDAVLVEVGGLGRDDQTVGDLAGLRALQRGKRGPLPEIVEVAGIEPASFDPQSRFLRAQPVSDCREGAWPPAAEPPP